MGPLPRSLLAGALIALISVAAYYVYTAARPLGPAPGKKEGYWATVAGMTLTTAAVGAAAALLFERGGGLRRVCADALGP